MGKVLSDQGSGQWSWIYGGLDWTARHSAHPKVASMSLGGSGTSSAMRTAVDAATGAGVSVVVAGGNDNSDSCNFSPAFVPSAASFKDKFPGDKAMQDAAFAAAVKSL